MFFSNVYDPYDFTIVSNQPIAGVFVVSNNEDAYQYITEELDYHTLSDGSAPLFIEAVGDFISDAEDAHLSCNYV